LLLFLGGCLSLYLAWITGTGEILEYIDFADPLNEMGFFGCCCSLAVGCFMACFCK
jgi:hypothetical protein